MNTYNNIFEGLKTNLYSLRFAKRMLRDATEEEKPQMKEAIDTYERLLTNKFHAAAHNESGDVIRKPVKDFMAFYRDIDGNNHRFAVHTSIDKPKEEIVLSHFSSGLRLHTMARDKRIKWLLHGHAAIDKLIRTHGEAELAQVLEIANTKNLPRQA